MGILVENMPILRAFFCDDGLGTGKFPFVIKNRFGERLANAYFLRKNGLLFGE